MNDNRFYVYALLDPRKPGKYEYGDICFLYEPFYIGKGKENRCYDHFRGGSLKKNSYKNNKIKKISAIGLDTIVMKIKKKLLEQDAFDLEKNKIAEIGRHDLKNGPLTNLDDGGRGGAGNILTENSKLKIGKNNAKYWDGKNISQKTINKIKNTKQKRPQNCKWRCRKYLAISPKGEEYVISNGLQDFCDKRNINREKMVLVAQGKRSHHKKWKCEYLDKKPTLPKDKIYLLTSESNKEYIINNIIDFSKKHNLDPRRLYEVARGKRCVHRGWKCEYYVEV